MTNAKLFKKPSTGGNKKLEELIMRKPRRCSAGFTPKLKEFKLVHHKHAFESRNFSSHHHNGLNRVVGRASSAHFFSFPHYHSFLSCCDWNRKKLSELLSAGLLPRYSRPAMCLLPQDSLVSLLLTLSNFSSSRASREEINFSKRDRETGLVSSLSVHFFFFVFFFDASNARFYCRLIK